MSDSIRLNLFSKNRDINSVIAEMTKSIDFHLQGILQKVSHYRNGKDSINNLFFVRRGQQMFFTFEGFGELLGYTVAISTYDDDPIKGLVGLNGEAMVYVNRLIPRKAKLLIIPPVYRSISTGWHS